LAAAAKAALAARATIDHVIGAIDFPTSFTRPDSK
jgi:hypothetical protein